MPIICGTDFSEASRSATEAARSFAARLHDQELWLVYVLEPTLASLEPVAEQAFQAAVEKCLAEEAERLQKTTSARVRHAVLVGGASETLLDFAYSKKARLLVVGSQGHGRLPLCRIGRVSERLARNARIPVLVVHEAAPFELWAKDERPLRVLLAVDWTRSCDAAIRWVQTLREFGPCDVVVTHVYGSDSGDRGARHYGLPRRYSLVERNPELEALLVRDLEARVGVLRGYGDVVFRPKHGFGRVGDHVLEIAESECVDIVVTGTHHRRGFSRLASVASVALHHSRQSVAIVPPPEGEIFKLDEVPRIRRVLVPTDLSALSRYAVPFGYTLLGGHRGEVYLFHVEAHRNDAMNDAEVVKQLRSIVPTQGVPANTSTHTEVVHHPDAARAICEAADRLGADAICMSTRGQTGFKRALVGSVAESVTQQSRIPVFLVRPLPQ